MRPALKYICHRSSVDYAAGRYDFAATIIAPFAYFLRSSARALIIEFIAVLSAFQFSPASATPIAYLYLKGEPDNYLFGGLEHVFTYSPARPTPVFLFDAQILNTIDSEPSTVQFILGYPFALLTFSTEKLGVPITPGTYLDVQRAQFEAPGHAGLDVAFNDRGCNDVGGGFVVDRAQFSGDTIEEFTARFVMYCSGGTGALFGSLGYFADPQPVPEPAPLSIAVLGLVGLSTLCRRSQQRSTRYRVVGPFH